MQELLLEIICSKKGGATKKEIVLCMKKFGISDFEIERMFQRIYSLRSRTSSFSIILLSQKKWVTFDNYDYAKNIARLTIENDKNKTYFGMGFTTPYWIRANHELFLNTFKEMDFS